MQSLIISFHAARHPLLQTGIFVGVTKSQSYGFFRFLANYFYNHNLVWGTDSEKKAGKGQLLLINMMRRIFLSDTGCYIWTSFFILFLKMWRNSWKTELGVSLSPIANSVQNIKALRMCSYCSLLSRLSSCWAVRSRSFNHKKILFGHLQPLHLQSFVTSAPTNLRTF